MPDQLPSPGVPPSVRLSSQLAPGGKYPATTLPKELDNPPLTRAIVPGANPPQYVLSDPFAGFGTHELLNIRAAMNTRLALLAEDKETDPENIVATQRVLQVLNNKLDPKPLNAGLVILPIPEPPAALIAPLRQITSGDLGPGA